MLTLFIITTFLLYMLFFPGTLYWVVRDDKKLNQIVVYSFLTGLHSTDAWYQWFFFFGYNPSFKMLSPDNNVPELEFVDYGMMRLTFFGISWTRMTYKVDREAIKAMHAAASGDTPKEPDQ